MYEFLKFMGITLMAVRPGNLVGRAQNIDDGDDVARFNVDDVQIRLVNLLVNPAANWNDRCWFPTWPDRDLKFGNSRLRPARLVVVVGDVNSFLNSNEILGTQLSRKKFLSDANEVMSDARPAARFLQLRIHSRKW